MSTVYHLIQGFPSPSYGTQYNKGSFSLLHLGLYRKRIFRRKRLRLRHGVALALILGLAWGMAGYGGNMVQEVSDDAPATVIASPSDEVLLNGGAVLADDTFVGQNIRPGLAGQISSIQNGIVNMLEASGQFFVSEKKVIVGKGDTLMGLLINRAGVGRDEAYQAVTALSKVYNPRDIVAGREITVFFHKDPMVTDAKFSGVRIEKDVVNAVTVNRDDSGNYTASKVEKSVHSEMRGYRGTINNSLYVDAKAAGVPDSVILELIKMYSWNVDFQREIHSGDKFEVMFEQFATEDGDVVAGKGEISYAKLTLAGESMPFYRFKDNGGIVDYYDDKGMSAKKPLMKTPVDGARLSSGFGSRRHPVLGYTKMHKGVDFAAPRGTPIYAAGDGTIAKIGPFSSYGNYVRIKHRQGLETAYAHMSRFKPGLRGGSRVKQGDVIGYIGTTGRSTGPHLHYEVMVSGNQVNPMSVKLPTGRALKGRELQNFKGMVAQAKVKFNALGRASEVAAASPQPSAAGKPVKN